MTTKTETEAKTKGPCYYDSLTRTKFFHGMLLTDEHLRAEQTYHRETIKRLNRHLWGAGIVCGLEVKVTGLCATIEPGLALDCEGNVIEVCKPIAVDLTDVCRKAYPQGCAPAKAEKIKKFLAVRYVEQSADPEPVLTAADDCSPPADGPRCEASKYREGLCVELLDACPNCPPCGDVEDKDALLPTVWTLRQASAQTAGKDAPDPVARLREVRPACTQSPPCAECGCEHRAVGLARLEIDCLAGKVILAEDEKHACCRTYVWSPRLFQWIVCRVFGNLGRIRLPVGELPSANAIWANPMQALWDLGELAVTPAPTDREQEVDELKRQVNSLKDQLDKLNDQVGAMEASRTARRPRDG